MRVLSLTHMSNDTNVGRIADDNNTNMSTYVYTYILI